MIMFPDSQATLHNKVGKVSIRNSWFPPLHTTCPGKLPGSLGYFMLFIYTYTRYSPVHGELSSAYFSFIPSNHLISNSSVTHHNILLDFKQNSIEKVPMLMRAAQVVSKLVDESLKRGPAIRRSPQWTAAQRNTTFPFGILMNCHLELYLHVYSLGIKQQYILTDTTCSLILPKSLVGMLCHCWSDNVVSFKWIYWFKHLVTYVVGFSQVCSFYSILSCALQLYSKWPWLYHQLLIVCPYVKSWPWSLCHVSSSV